MQGIIIVKDFFNLVHKFSQLALSMLQGEDYHSDIQGIEKGSLQIFRRGRYRS